MITSDPFPNFIISLRIFSCVMSPRTNLEFLLFRKKVSPAGFQMSFETEVMKPDFLKPSFKPPQPEKRSITFNFFSFVYVTYVINLNHLIYFHNKDKYIFHNFHCNLVLLRFLKFLSFLLSCLESR